MMASKKRSWSAGLSCAMGLLSLLGVACFYFPEALTSQQFRTLYSESFARHLLLAGLTGAFVLGVSAIMRGRDRRAALIGVVSAGIAVLLGGITIKVHPIHESPYSLGLDWFIVSLFISAVIFLPIERMMAVRPISPLRPEWRTDMAYFFFSHVLIQFVLIAVTASTAAVAALAAFPEVQAAIQRWPVWIQFLLAVFVADLFQAGLHRAYHKAGWLWRFHAIHHSSPAMDWLAGSRVHLLEMLATRTVVLMPLVVLGFSQPVVNAYVVLVGIQAVFAHANVNVNFKWLEYLIVTPRYHHWHHARDEAYVDANYAIHLPLIDMLMGTFRLPPAGVWPEHYGVLEPQSVPRGILPQLAAPFVPNRTYEDYVGRPGERRPART